MQISNLVQKYVSGIAFIRYTHSQNIGKPNYQKIFSTKIVTVHPFYSCCHCAPFLQLLSMCTLCQYAPFYSFVNNMHPFYSSVNVHPFYSSVNMHPFSSSVNVHPFYSSVNMHPSIALSIICIPSLALSMCTHSLALSICTLLQLCQ